MSGTHSAAIGADDSLLQVEGLERYFGHFHALRGVTASFARGRLTSIIGPNGAGKSTLFNLLCGALSPTRGRIVLDGQDITHLPQHRYAMLGVSKSFQITSIFPALTVLDNVRVAALGVRRHFSFLRSHRGLRDTYDVAHACLRRVGLGDCAGRNVAALSHGQQRALEMAIALAPNPRVLLLDEPTAGMSPEETTVMMNLIERLAEERTVILVEHKMKLIMGISDRLLVLHQGALLASGTPSEIQNNDAVREVYLGKKG